jgi:hypothetical protein
VRRDERGIAQSTVLTWTVAVVILGGTASLVIPWFLRNATPSNQTASTTGKVVNCQSYGNSGFYNFVSFEVGGKSYTALTREGNARTCVYTDGQEVTVTYDPRNPSSASVSLGPPFNGDPVTKPLILFVILSVPTVAFNIFRSRRNTSTTSTFSNDDGQA